MSERSTDRSGMDLGVFLPLLFLLIALLVQAFAELGELRATRKQLDAQFVTQRDAIDQAQKLRTQLEAIAGDTAVLANAGNANAIRLRDYLAQQGVNINPPVSPTGEKPPS